MSHLWGWTVCDHSLLTCGNSLICILPARSPGWCSNSLAGLLLALKLFLLRFSEALQTHTSLTLCSQPFPIVTQDAMFYKHSQKPPWMLTQLWIKYNESLNWFDIGLISYLSRPFVHCIDFNIPLMKGLLLNISISTSVLLFRYRLSPQNPKGRSALSPFLGCQSSSWREEVEVSLPRLYDRQSSAGEGRVHSKGWSCSVLEESGRNIWLLAKVVLEVFSKKVKHLLSFPSN